MDNISMIVGSRIRKYRLKLNMTQEELAEKAGLHHTYIGQLERGEKNATLESIEKVVLGLGISFELLFEKLSPNVSGLSANIAAECYDLVDALSLDEQKAILELIRRTIAYKKI